MTEHIPSSSEGHHPFSEADAEWILDATENLLFEHEEGAFEETICSLIKENNAHQTAASDGFVYMGKVYWDQDTPRPRFVPALDLSLWDKMETALLIQKSYKRDRKLISQMLSLALEKAATWQEARDVLPNSLVNALGCLRDIPRKGLTGGLFTNPIHQAQFSRAIEKIDTYLGMRFVH